ncbi:synaptopodin-2 isoform X3 [Anoplopoma fimbria]|uniref:synaptopodin-2 isoform X3 n=1 Tax=Anoplopoma fimbria TaxID=229290 RepID=UPI0023EB9F76|nr:synaptopodin-2 isoform X3 [Anoplopoma fimbria]
MGTGDYICVTLRGGAPWGFSLREGEGDTYRPFFVSQVEEGGRAFLAGVQEGDEVVSLNGEPCADLTLLRAFALIDTSIDCLQLLVKRYCTILSGESESEETYCGGRDSSGEALKSTTLHIFTPKHRSQSPRELYVSESQEEAYYGELGSDTEFHKGPQLLYTQLHVPSSGDGRDREHDFQDNDGEGRQCFSPGDMVELQVSLAEQTLDDMGCTSLGSAHGIDGELSNKEAVGMIHTTAVSHFVPCSVREPLGQHGVVLSSPSMLGQVEVILRQPAASGAGRGLLSVGGPRVSGSVGSQSEGEEGGGHCEGVPGSFTVSFEIPSEEARQAEEQDSDSEGDEEKPNKHRARHARLRRSESLSEKQVKELLGRSYSLSPLVRVPSTGQNTASASSSPKPPAWASTTPPARQASWPQRVRKPLMPWEAASRHPLGLVDEAFAFQDLQQSLATNVCLAAQRKMLPEPPAEWKARVSYEAQQKPGSQTWSRSQSGSERRAPLPSFGSLTRSAVSAPVGHAGYRSLPRQWQPQRASHVTVLHHDDRGEENAGSSNLQGGSSPGRARTTLWLGLKATDS